MGKRTRRYEVRVARICPQYIRLEVEAGSMKQAKEKALAGAPLHNFLDGTTGEPTYEVVEVNRVSKR